MAGDGPEQVDLVHAFYSRFPLIVAPSRYAACSCPVIQILALPIKAVLRNLMSVGATYGVLVIIGNTATDPTPSGKYPPPASSSTSCH